MDFFKRSKSSDINKQLPTEVSREQKESRFDIEKAATDLDRQINVLYSMYVGIIGAEKVVLRAGKFEALPFIHSDNPRQRLVGIQRIILESADYSVPPADEDIPAALHELEEALADMLAHQAVEERLERQINQRIEEKHQEYVRDLKLQLINEEAGDVETPQTKEKLEKLEKLDTITLSKSIMELVRPKSLDEIVGQKAPLQAMIGKLATPYPQHMILYGPPGVGKTTAARLALQTAKQKTFTPFGEAAPFVETSGTTLRWDSRDITNPLIGSVHDPIYQGARRDLAETGIPEPKPGLVTDAHGGVLFIDEIGEMDPLLLNKLLKVLEDKKVTFESSYYDSTDSNIPAYIKKLFAEGAPADFILIGATTRDPSEINPAIRSRCAEIIFSPLETGEIEQIVRQAAANLDVELEDGVGHVISEYTIEGRKAVNILADAYSLALDEESGKVERPITKSDIYQVARISHFSPFGTSLAHKEPVVGHVNGLGVSGYMGSIIEIEAIAFPTEKGKGTVRFNDTAGSMAKDSVFNAAAVVRKLTGKDVHDYDIHVNVVGGGNIDGPSAGCAIVTAILSAIEGRPVRQDTCITGEISVQGLVKPVGGVFEKAYGAKQAQATHMIIPMDNKEDITEGHLGLTIHPVERIEEIVQFMFV